MLLTPIGRYLISWLGLMLCIFLIGCQSENVQHEHLEYPHKPDNYKQAVLRLKEIHDSLVNVQSLPATRTFLKIASDAPNETGDHGENYFQEIDPSRSVSPADELLIVTIVDEWIDLVQWLPMIAADSNLPKTPWDTINTLAEELMQLSRDYPRTDVQDFQFRYLQDADRFEIIFDQLEDLFDEYDQSHQKDTF